MSAIQCHRRETNQQRIISAFASRAYLGEVFMNVHAVNDDHLLHQPCCQSALCSISPANPRKPESHHRRVSSARTYESNDTVQAHGERNHSCQIILPLIGTSSTQELFLDPWMLTRLLVAIAFRLHGQSIERGPET